MDDTTAERLAERVGHYVRRRLLRDGAAHVPGLGTFAVERASARMETAPDGTTTLHPPEFTLRFTPDA
jgi:nucleoid DNA-binding protein